jgi:uncharacterized protein YfaT (DUF1175 family)
MNANELAEKLEAIDMWRDERETRNACADLLRKQADLIRNLEKSLGFKNSGYETINLTPQLELTDEEIVNLYKETEADNGGIREFARAILRKAQEK